jgi:hypothetical protein
MRAICPTYALHWFDKGYKLWSPSLCNYLYPHVTYRVSGTNTSVLLSTTLSGILTFCSSLGSIDQFSHENKTLGSGYVFPGNELMDFHRTVTTLKTQKYCHALTQNNLSLSRHLSAANSLKRGKRDTKYAIHVNINEIILCSVGYMS